MSAAKILHRERIPTTGCLVVPGRIEAPELAKLEQMFEGRTITWLIEENALLDPDVRSHLEHSGSGAAFSDADTEPAAAGHQLRSTLEKGGVLIHVHGRVAAAANSQIHVPGRTLRTLGNFGLPLLPIGVDYPRESSLSIERQANLPRSVFSVGEPIEAAKASGPALRQGLLLASEEAFSDRELLRGSLASAVLEGLLKHGGRTRIHDGSDDSELRLSRVLAAALVFSRHIRTETESERVGIILPPGKAGLVANLAVLFAGKVPVNFNFTASHEAVRSAMRQADCDRYITADPFVRKVASFPWPPNRDLIYVERVLPNLKSKIVTWTILSKILPVGLIRTIFGIGKRKGDDEAVLLFTSGSSGDPKGVVLTNRNLLANVCQFNSRVAPPSGYTLLGCLPLFHSFGCTVTLWFPCIEGVNLVTYPNPLEAKRLAELIDQQDVDLMIATPTFLRGYMRRVKPEQLRKLKLVVTGAEKLPDNLADSFVERFNLPPQEGYGLTETSPVTNFNLPDPVATDGATVLPSSRRGSVGQMLPGMAVRLTNPANDRDCPLDQQGIIWLRGPNVFPGYLGNQKRTREVIDSQGWFRTGDVGRMDDDGFLFIEGRISRFSKIAGEMVPHETVEAAVNKALGLDAEAERKIAVVGVPDPQKGEAIILLSTVAGRALEQECIDLRYKLMDAGIPSLWCPKAIVPIEEIPVLASGKLDLKGCQALADH